MKNEGEKLFKNRMNFCFFAIECDCDAKEVVSRLGIEPDAVLSLGEENPFTRKAVTKPTVVLGYNGTYSESYNDMLKRTVADLLPRTELLSKIKDELGLCYRLETGGAYDGELLVLDGPLSDFIINIGAEKEQRFSFF